MTETTQARAFRTAALHAQGLVVAARSIEARVSALAPDTPEAVVEETVTLVRATSLHIAATVHELIAASVRLTSGVAAAADSGSRGHPTEP